MTENPCVSTAAATGTCETSVGQYVAKIATGTALIVAFAAAAWITLMLRWIHDVRPSSSFTAVAIAGLWLTAPYAGSAGVALLFQRSCSGSLITLLGTLANSGLGSAVYYNHWRLSFYPLVPSVPGTPEMMNCGPPLELFFPIAQWMGVVLIAGIATIVSLIMSALFR